MGHSIYWCVWRFSASANPDMKKGETDMEEKNESVTAEQQCAEKNWDLDDLIFQGEGWLASDR